MFGWLFGYKSQEQTNVAFFMKEEQKKLEKIKLEKIKDRVSFYLNKILTDEGFIYEVLDKKTNIKIGDLSWIYDVKGRGAGWQLKIDSNVTQYSRQRPPLFTQNECRIYQYVDVLIREARINILYRKKLACNLYVKGISYD